MKNRDRDPRGEPLTRIIELLRHVWCEPEPVLTQAELERLIETILAMRERERLMSRLRPPGS